MKVTSTEKKLEMSPVKVLQNEKIPKFRFSGLTAASSHQALPCLKSEHFGSKTSTDSK